MRPEPNDTEEETLVEPFAGLPTDRDSSRSHFADPAVPSLVRGEKIAARFVVREMVGRGGYGEVYAVDDLLRPGPPRALKLHRLGARGREHREALRAEFGILATLRHPHLASVHDYGHAGEDIAFFTQDLVEGVALDRIGLSIAEPRMLELLAQLCRALAYLHSRGVLHRDVKPSNVLVDLARDHVTLLDFGLARALGRIEEGNVVGTPAFVAPEVVLGGVADARTDLYALGVTLYKLAAGRLPFRGKPIDVLRQQIDGVPPPLAERVPPGLASLIATLMAKEPARRPASAQSVLRALSLATSVPVELETEETRASYALSGRHVGAAAELERLVRVATTAGSALVVGEGGAGKSRLVREAGHRLQLDGHTFIRVELPRARGDRSLLERLARVVLLPDVRAALSEDHRFELARVVPELRRRRERFAPEVDPESGLRARIDALAWAIAHRLASRPGALVVEDLHYATTETVAGLATLVERLRARGGAAALVATARPCEAADRFEALSGADRIDLGPLSAGDARELVASMFGAPELLDETPLGSALRDGAHTALFVQESVRHAIDRGAIEHDGSRWSVTGTIELSTLDALLTARVASLPGPAKRLANAAAVLGLPATAAELASVADLADAGLAEGFAGATRAGILDEVGTRSPSLYGVHDRFADVCIATAERAELLAMHERSARVLEMRAREHDFHALGSAVAHRLLGGDRSGAAALLSRAVSAAERAGRPAAGAVLLARHLHEAWDPVPPEELLRWHDLARRGGLRDDARAAFAELEASASPSMKPLLVELDLRRARLLADDGDAAAAERALGRARRRARALRDDVLETETHLAIADVAQSYGSVADALRSYAHAARTAARAGKPELETRARVGACNAALHFGAFDDAGAFARGAAALARGSGDPALESDALRALGNTQRELGSLRASQRTFMRAVKLARRAGSPELEAKALNNAATSAYRLGRAHEAMPALERSIMLKERYGGAVAGLISRNNLGAVLASWGDFEGGRRELEIVIAAGGGRHTLVSIPALTNLAEIRALEGDLGGAFELASQARTVARERESSTVGHQPLALIVRLHAMGVGTLDDGDATLEAMRSLGLASKHDLVRHHAGAAMLADARGDLATMERELRTVMAADEKPSPCYGLFGTGIEIAWMRALASARAGRMGAARRQRESAERLLERVAGLAPAHWSRERCMSASPIHRAIRDATFDTPPGWTYHPVR